jgi:hypothetical protein
MHGLTRAGRTGARRVAIAGAALALGGGLAAALSPAAGARGDAHHQHHGRPRHHGHGHSFPGHPGSGTPATAVADSYTTPDLGTLSVDARHGILANDPGGPDQLISHTDPSHGSLTLNPDGSFQYVPELGFTGDDTFTYTISNAVSLFTDNLPPLGTFGGVSINAGGYGSSVAPVPGRPDEFYGLTDRGPNVSAPNGDDVLPIPSFDPSIGKFLMGPDGQAILLRRIPLQDASGHPYSGLVNSGNATGETMENLQGHVLANDPDGYDSEGLVAMRDGTFWVSDEYGPYITHFSADGRQLQRLSPQDGSLPRELANRVPNKGMEGLAITPDGSTLVGLMQSALQQKDLGTTKATTIVPTRIVTYNLRTRAVHEYLYLLHDPKTNGTANSEITALSDHTFLVDERDGNFPGPTAFKQLWKIDIDGATDVGPSAHVPGAGYDATHGGLLIGGTASSTGKTIEGLTNGENTAQAAATLQQAHITPVSETEFLDVDKMLLSLDPTGAFYDHDKIEGVATTDGGRHIWISNDSDFGIAGVTNTAAPWQLESKIDPASGLQDNGEYLEIDMSRVDPSTSAAGTSTATVTIHVGPGQ